MGFAESMIFIIEIFIIAESDLRLECRIPVCAATDVSAAHRLALRLIMMKFLKWDISEQYISEPDYLYKNIFLHQIQKYLSHLCD